MSQLFFEKNGLGELYSAYNPNAIRVLTEMRGPSKTRQEFTEECDVNTIMDRYMKTSVFPFKEPGPPVYYDFVGMPDLQNALADLHRADDAFMQLPAKVRKEFDNDPVRFVEFATNEDNLKQLRDWGLAAPEKAPDAPMRVEVVNAPPIVPVEPAKT